MRNLYHLLILILIFHYIITEIKAVRDSKYYDILEIGTDADEKTIKKAYKRLALQWHPDRNPGNEEEANSKFAEISEAYEVLSDPEKRRNYDQFGTDAINGGSGGGGFKQHFHFHGGDPFEMFDNIFKNMGGGGGGNFGRQSKSGNSFHFEFSTGGSDAGGRFHHQQQRHHHHHQREPEKKENLYELDPYVVTMNEENFNDYESEYIRIVDFYTPWCGHCKELAPKWKNVAKDLRGVIRVGAVNCEKEEELCHENEISGYPTIIAYIPNSNSKVTFEGRRDKKSIETWALNLIPNDKVNVIKDKRNLNSFFQNCDQNKSNNKVTWKLCLILFTDKIETSPLYKSLALGYDGKIAFGEIKQNQKLNKNFNVTELPTIMAVCNGNINIAEIYSGKMQGGKIRNFLDGFRGGKKCNKAAILDENTNLNNLSAGELKEFLRDQNIFCEGCFEKDDYIKKVKEIITIS